MVQAHLRAGRWAFSFLAETMSRPTEIRSGDTYTWDVSSSLYPATDGWTLKVTISNSNSFKRVSAATATDGVSYTITLSALDTGALRAGTYAVIEAVEKGIGASLERHTLSSYPLTVLENLAGAVTPIDARSHARKVLDAIQAVMEGRASTDQQSLTIGDKTLVQTPMRDLLALKGHYQKLVDNEDAVQKAALGLATGRTYNIKFE